MGALLYRLVRASVQELPENIAMDNAGPVAFEDSSDTKSTLSDHDLCLTGKVKARPGYEST